MKTTRISIFRLMVLVAVLALDLTAIRLAVSEEYGHIGLFGDATTVTEMAILFGPIALVAQVGFALAAMGRRSRRPFWIGLAVASLVFGPLFLGLNLADVPLAGKWLNRYLDGFDGLVGKFPALSAMIGDNMAVSLVAFLIYAMLPQLVVAVLGGMLAAVIVRLIKKDRTDPAPGGR